VLQASCVQLVTMVVVTAALVIVMIIPTIIFIVLLSCRNHCQAVHFINLQQCLVAYGHKAKHCGGARPYIVLNMSIVSLNVTRHC